MHMWHAIAKTHKFVFVAEYLIAYHLSYIYSKLSTKRPVL